MAEAIFWITPSGSSIDLTDHENYDVLRGIRNDIMPSYDLVMDKVPLVDGSTLRQIDVSERPLDLPMYIYGTSRSDIVSKFRSLAQQLRPTSGIGTLRYTRDDGSYRDLRCRYSGGHEGDDGTDSQGSFWQKVSLSFLAEDPYWYGPSISVSYTAGTPSPFFPFFPLVLVSSTVFATVTIDNTGEVDCYPVFTLVGPGSDIRIDNLTTGKYIDIDTVSLSSGESVSIDTRPTAKTVTKNDGTNWFPYMTDMSSLFCLQPGNNTLKFEMSGADGSSYASISYQPRYLTS